MRWDLGAVADRLGEVIARAEADLRLEQAVHGLDVEDERALQARLAAGLAPSYGVAREVHYPSTVGRRLTHRPRCDLVLVPLGTALQAGRQLPLFDRPVTCPPEEALWLEVKTAAQFGAGGVRQRRYGAQWYSGLVDDLRKMAAEPFIREGAMVLVVFNESRDILEKDLALFESVLVREGVLAGFRHVRSVPVMDRIGHRLCTVALWPTMIPI